MKRYFFTLMLMISLLSCKSKLNEHFDDSCPLNVGRILDTMLTLRDFEINSIGRYTTNDSLMYYKLTYSTIDLNKTILYDTIKVYWDSDIQIGKYTVNKNTKKVEFYELSDTNRIKFKSQITSLKFLIENNCLQYISTRSEVGYFTKYVFPKETILVKSRNFKNWEFTTDSLLKKEVIKNGIYLNDSIIILSNRQN